MATFPFRKLTLPCGQGGLETRPYVHKLIPIYPAHPELVEGWGGWFDKLTMSGRDYWCHYRRDYWRNYRRHSAIFHNSLSQPFTLTPCRVFRRAEARPRCTRGIS